jgi:hypothetical protein
MGKPFKLNQPEARNVNAPAPRPFMNPGEPAKHAAAEGETLVEAGVELTQPNGDVGGPAEEGGTGHGEGHPQRPVYPPAIRWPEAPGVSHKPFKV